MIRTVALAFALFAALAVAPAVDQPKPAEVTWVTVPGGVAPDEVTWLGVPVGALAGPNVAS